MTSNERWGSGGAVCGRGLLFNEVAPPKSNERIDNVRALVASFQRMSNYVNLANVRRLGAGGFSFCPRLLFTEVALPKGRRGVLDFSSAEVLAWTFGKGGCSGRGV